MKIDSSMINNVYSSALSQEKEVNDTNAFKDTLEKAANSKDLEKLKEASQEFEAYFLNTLFKEMRKTIQEGGLTEKSQARTTFEEMLDEEMSKTISKSGGVGLSDMIYNNMIRAYGATSSVPQETEQDSNQVNESEKDNSSLNLKG